MPRRAAPAVILLGAVLLLAIVGGALIGHSSSGGSGVALTNSASSADLELSFPATWHRVLGPAPQIPGVTLADPLALSPTTPASAALVAGMTATSGPTLLPDSLLSLLPGGAKPGDPVRIGNLEGYRYADLRPKGLSGSLTLYVIPTNRGVASIACVTPVAPSANFSADCPQVAASVKLTGPTPYPLGPSAAYAGQLARAFSGLSAARSATEPSLRGAATPGAQAQAALALASAYGRTSHELTQLTLSPALQAANAAIAAALQGVSRAYTKAARAAGQGNSGAYAAAGRSITRAAGQASGALAALRGLGYRVPG